MGAGAVFLLSLPILLSMAFLGIGGRDPVYYLAFLLLGCLTMTRP